MSRTQPIPLARASSGCLARLFSGCLNQILFIVVLGGAVMWAVIVVTHPWALRIGGRWTPLFTWFASGKLVTQGGTEYSLFLVFLPAKDVGGSVTPVSSVQGSGFLCTAPGVAQSLTLDGGLEGVWPRSTQGRKMALNLWEPRRPSEEFVPVNPPRGVLHFEGIWRGADLPMTTKGTRFRSGLAIEPASVTLRPGFFRPFTSQCGRPENYPRHR